ncbi:hypothetical protein F4859DRAFT_258909 [Xylaria cf. heliscus]|nr:hypothetical protein F4859DRAFT_258909 [Xylaria cf. heliscus]
MASLRNDTVADTPIRQSCDRCHGQKLRCARADTSSGACDRCLRRGSQCVYSFSLPKGRPSIYNLADKSRGTTTSTRDRTADLSDSPPNAIVTPDLTPDLTPVESEPESIRIHADSVVDSSPKAGSSIQPGAENNSNFMNSMRQELHGFTDTQPPLESLTWDDTQPHNWSNSTLNHPKNTILDPSQMLDDPPYLINNDGLHDWGLLEDEASVHDAAPQMSIQTFPQLHGCCQQLESSDLKRHNSIHTNNRGKSGDSGRTIITQLSQLMTRFTRLHRLSYDLASTLDSSYQENDTVTVHGGYRIDETTFTSVSEWLVRDSVTMDAPIPKHSSHARFSHSPKEGTTSTVLSHLFSASHELLETLRRLQINDRANPIDVARNTGSSSSPPVMGYPEPPCFSPATPTTPHSHPPNDQSNNIRHLVIACYTMLLNIYVSVLNTLERHAWASRHMDGASLGDIQLASIVQLCIYLTSRQYKAVGAYLSVQQTAQTSWQDRVASGHDPANATAEEDMRSLKMEVERRLVRLQQMLHA